MLKSEWFALLMQLPWLLLVAYGWRTMKREQDSSLHFHSDFWRDVSDAGRVVMFHPNKMVKGPVGPQGPQGPQGITGTPLLRKK